VQLINEEAVQKFSWNQCTSLSDPRETSKLPAVPALQFAVPVPEITSSCWMKVVLTSHSGRHIVRLPKRYKTGTCSMVQVPTYSRPFHIDQCRKTLDTMPKTDNHYFFGDLANQTGVLFAKSSDPNSKETSLLSGSLQTFSGESIFSKHYILGILYLHHVYHTVIVLNTMA